MRVSQQHLPIHNDSHDSREEVCCKCKSGAHAEEGVVAGQVGEAEHLRRQGGHQAPVRTCALDTTGHNGRDR